MRGALICQCQGCERLFEERDLLPCSPFASDNYPNKAGDVPRGRCPCCEENCYPLRYGGSKERMIHE
jgi:hypothetical protein